MIGYLTQKPRCQFGNEVLKYTENSFLFDL